MDNGIQLHSSIDMTYCWHYSIYLKIPCLFPHLCLCQTRRRLVWGSPRQRHPSVNKNIWSNKNILPLDRYLLRILVVTHGSGRLAPLSSSQCSAQSLQTEKFQFPRKINWVKCKQSLDTSNYQHHSLVWGEFLRDLYFYLRLHMRSPPEEPHLASRVVTFSLFLVTSYIIYISWAYFLC